MRAASRLVVISALVLPALASSCDREQGPDDAPAAAAPPVDTPLAGPVASDAAADPKEIYFDLTAFQWYREGRPLMHEGRAYLPQADPVVVETELREGGTYEGVTYYVAEDAREPVYTLYVPVYYRYWQRFTVDRGR